MLKVFAIVALAVAVTKNAGLEALTILLETSRLFARAALRVLFLGILCRHSLRQASCQF